MTRAELAQAYAKFWEFSGIEVSDKEVGLKDVKNTFWHMVTSKLLY